MKTLISLGAICSLLIINSAFANSIRTLGASGHTPLCFTENKGQWQDDVMFRCDAGGAIVWICKDRIVYQILRKIERAASNLRSSEGRNQPSFSANVMELFDHEPDSIEQLVITARFVNSNPDVQVVGEGLTEYKCNYFLGNDPKKWHADVPNYQEAVLQGVYEGVDLRFFAGDNGGLTYQYNIAPTANVAQVKLEYDRLDKTSVQDMGEFTGQSKWQEITGLLGAPGTATELSGLQVGEEPGNMQSALLGDRSPQEVQLVYSTYLGGSNNESGFGIAVDDSGSAYVTGQTYSTDFPTQNAYDASLNGSRDVFVTKLSSSGSSLIYSTFLGGSSHDDSYDIAVDDSGNAYVVGLTISSDFPSQNAYDTSFNGGIEDVFVSKLSSSGSSLIYSTYLGGSGDDFGFGIAVDSSGSAYVTGSTVSTNFPTQSPYDASYNGGTGDVFVSKLSSSGSSLIYSTFLGGSSHDDGDDIAVDGSGNAYVTGETSSANFPTQSPYDASYNGGNWDVFVSKLSSSGSSLIYSTYLGGSSDDYGGGIAVDGSDNAYVTGTTFSTNFPTQNAYDATYNYWDVFVSKLSSSGSSLIYSTYLGGSDSDGGLGIAVDGSGSACVTGQTYSTDFPTQNAYDASLNGSSDVFVSKLSGSGSSLNYSTYLGGEHSSIAVDGSDNAHVTGYTTTADFPTQNAYDASYNGGQDVFVAKLEFVTFLCGDADGNAIVTISDAVYLINYIFSGGPAPVPILAGDADCNNIVTISDAVYLINYIFSGGPAPCAACP